jgi:hypothetical protein
MSTTYQPDNCLFLINGLIDSQESIKQIRKKYAETEASNKKTMVIHFHGGLVEKTAALKAAEFLTSRCYGDVAFPVFFIWESGIIHSLTETAKFALQNHLYKTVYDHVTQFLEAKLKGISGNEMGTLSDSYSTGEVISEIESLWDGLEEEAIASVYTLTEEDERFFRNTLQERLEAPPALPDEPIDDMVPVAEPADLENLSDEDPIKSTRKVTYGSLLDAETLKSLSPLLRQSIEQELNDVSQQNIDSLPEAQAAGFSNVILLHVVRTAFTAVKNIMSRLASQRDHGVQATIVEEIFRALYLGKIGRDTWLTMKAFTAAAFGPTERAGAVPGGTAFLKLLADLKNTRDEQGKSESPERIVLVGHSTGAVYICHFLKEARKLLPEQNFEVIFLAPACDFKLLDDTLNEVEKSVSHLRIFAMSDALERAEFLFDVDELKKPGLVPLTKTYPGSLLYFVSGALEDEADKPIVGMQRFYSDKFAEKYLEVAGVRKHLEKYHNALIWSVAEGLEGLNCACNSHGGFDDEEKTLASLNFILGKGFPSMIAQVIPPA